MKVSFLLILLLLTINVIPNNTVQEIKKEMVTKGSITVASKQFEVIYYDNPTSRSLINQMPFTVKLKDYAGMEKIFIPCNLWIKLVHQKVPIRLLVT